MKSLINHNYTLSKQILSFGVNCAIIFMAILCIFSIKAYASNRVIFIFRYAAFVVGSSSMEPAYPVNSIVVIEKSSFSSLEVGDVIAFRSAALNGKVAFHRIVKITERGIYTKGDNNAHEDNQLITVDTYVGKEAFSITFFARFWSKYANPLSLGGYFLFFFCLSLCIYTISVKKR